MKLLKSLFAIALFMANNTISAQSVTDKWKQLGNFHELMSNSFKPSEEGDFKPIKLNSQELVTKVDALDITTIPQELRSDAEIMREFENVHDIYNRLVYVCNNLKK